MADAERGLQDGASAIGERIAAADWTAVARDLDANGYATLTHLLGPGECAEIAACYDDAQLFRRHIVMEKHAYGRGEYKYFAYPLPALVDGLRSTAYRHLAPIANRWVAALRKDAGYPADHASFIRRCHAAGQRRPTPLILRYGPDDYNRMHQDLYGEIAFPLQLAVLLSRPGADFTGGEFILTEQRARMQSRAEVVPLAQGDAVIFAVNERPVPGARVLSRAKLRHGVSCVRSGQRFTLGVIFHDAA
jgi:uncharacterized protein